MKLLLAFLLFSNGFSAVGPQRSTQPVRRIVAYMQALNWQMRNEVNFHNYTNLTYAKTEPDGPVEWEFVSEGIRYTFHYSGTDYINQPSIKPHLSIFVAKADALDNLQTITLRDSDLRGTLDAVRTWGDIDLCKVSARGCEAYQDLFDEALSSALVFMAKHPIKK